LLDYQDFIVDWRVSIQISLEVPLSSKLLLYWKEFSSKICLKMFESECAKEKSVQRTDCDSNRECLKFDKVGKHSSSTEIITANKDQCIIPGKCTAALIHLKIHHTSRGRP